MWSRKSSLVAMLIGMALAFGGASSSAAEPAAGNLNWNRDVREAWRSALQADRPPPGMGSRRGPGGAGGRPVARVTTSANGLRLQRARW